MAQRKSDPVIELLLTFIDQGFDKKAWHGPTLRGSIRRVGHKEALWPPTPKHHSIWDIVVHAAYWKYAVHRRLTGGEKGMFPKEGSDWFGSQKRAGAAGWKKDIALLEKYHRLLRKTVAGLSSKGLKRMDLIYGIASHDLYHAGQIQLLKRLRHGGVAKS
jgi:hypothetical protein